MEAQLAEVERNALFPEATPCKIEFPKSGLYIRKAFASEINNQGEYVLVKSINDDFEISGFWRTGSNYSRTIIRKYSAKGKFNKKEREYLTRRGFQINEETAVKYTYDV
jgi:hypothetical protein